jgi:dipeptidyl aminopeptidase/acylaminoacyl peptidase
VTRPVVPETVCPIEIVTLVATDGYRSLAVLRKPPGPRPFPVAVWFHGGITTEPRDRLESRARDLLAVVDHRRSLPYVDPASVALCGCNGGGDLALEAAARRDVCAVAAEEPPSVLITGVFNNATPFQAIDAFCRRHVRTAPRALDPSLLRHETVREGPIGVFQ